MQLKEEFRTYEALRREHDAQIVQIATEAGLRIAPDQWSSLLYGDTAHKSHMQSIIDKLQTPQSFGQSVQVRLNSIICMRCQKKTFLSLCLPRLLEKDRERSSRILRTTGMPSSEGKVFSSVNI